jgi:glycosyltransferase involved in cell wall biosynthesis
MNQPLVSVILPVFNAAATLEAALESIVSQSYPFIELIVVDGYSTDDTPRIISTYSKHINHLISEADHGIYDAINKGIAKSSGEWIYILGADDCLASARAIETMISNAAKNVTLLYGDVLYVGDKQSLVPRTHKSIWSRQLWWRNTLHQQGALYHRSLFNDFRFDTRFRILGDYDFHLRLFQHNIKTAYTHITVAHCAAQGTSKKFSGKLYREEIILKKKRLPFIVWLVNLPLILIKYVLKQLP